MLGYIAPYSCVPAPTVAEAFVIGCPIVNYFPSDYKIQVEQGIGVNFAAADKPTNVSVAIYDSTCSSPILDKSTITVSEKPFLETDSFDGMTGKFAYDLNIALAGVSPNSLVAFDDVTYSSGSISFCAEVTTEYSDVEITFQKTVFSLGFDLSQVAFCLGDLKIEELDPETEEVEDALQIEVNACVCNDSYECLDGPITVQQNDDISICLVSPKSAAVEINNFALSFKNQENNYLYQAVDLGAGGWIPRVPTTVSKDSGIIKVTTIMVAGLFDNGNEGVLVEGVAQLGFSGEDMKSASLHNFQMVVDLDAEEKGGCIRSMLNTVISAFK